MRTFLQAGLGFQNKRKVVVCSLNGGSFNNALNFTLSMGCGTWGGNSFSENLNYRHFINITHLVTEVAEDKPSEDELFGAYLAKHGQ